MYVHSGGGLVSKSSLTATPWSVAHQAPLSMGFFQAAVLEWVSISFFYIYIYISHTYIYGMCVYVYVCVCVCVKTKPVSIYWSYIF